MLEELIGIEGFLVIHNLLSAPSAKLETLDILDKFL